MTADSTLIHHLTKLRKSHDDQLQAAARLQASINSTLKEYGEGVRPSWVSADVAIDNANREQHVKAADDIAAEIAEIERQIAEGK